jgi:hypothetical protein
MKILKSISAFALAIILMVSAMGVMLNKHYCMGEFSEASIITLADRSHCCDSDNMPMDCCEDEASFYSLDSEFKQTTKFQIDAPSTPLVAEIMVFDYDLENPEFNQEYPNPSPIPLVQQDIPVLNQAFLL